MPQTYSYGMNGGWIGLGEESTWNTTVARNTYLEVVSNSLVVEKQRGYSRSARGFDPVRAFDQLVRAQGDINVELQYEGYLKLFKALLGNYSVSNVTTNAYRHEFVRSASLPPGLTIEASHDQQTFLFPGCKINQATLRFQPDQYPEGTFSFVGPGGSVNNTTSTPSFPSDRVLLNSFGVVTAGTSGSTDYSEYIESIEIMIGNSLDSELRRIGSASIREPARSSTRPDCTIKLALKHGSVTKQLVDDYLSGTPQKLKIKYTSTAAIGATTASYTWMFEAPACDIASAFPRINDSGQEPLEVELRPLASNVTAGSYEYTSTLSGAFKVTFWNGSTNVTSAGA